MWTTLSISHWTCLITLAFAMLLFAPEADSVFISLPCCYKYKEKKPEFIKKCFEQKKRYNCPHHAFLVETEGKMRQCIKPTSEWLMELIEKGELKCPPEISFKHRFEFLDEDE